MADNNPYAAPQATVVSAAPASAPGGPDILQLDAPALRAGAGANWIGEAWALYRKAWGVLILMMIIYFVLAIVMSLVPLIGDLVMGLAFGIWMAGWGIAFDKLHHDQPISAGDLFAGFAHPNMGRLLGLGLLYMGSMIGIFAVAVVLFLALFLGGDITIMQDMARIGDQITANLVLFFLLMVLVLTAVFMLFAWIVYAPMLVAFHNMPLFAACNASFRATLRNWLPMTVYGLLIVGLFLASVLTLFLGLLVLFPVMMGVYYVSYRQIFLKN